ncbi:MAG: hypothetical protein JO235_14890 [Chroococcidiopsidaceae cyanobacterium CP_BM_RX_35]|nr:hypothetical protein [Chroococcidiopsidaceae cyanobacterium CP_BM_RX_35]
MICQSCGVEAQTKYIEFYQNIGALVVRFHKAIKGNLCKSCINKYFWRFTPTTLILGWWGVISFFVTPLFIVNNIIRYLLALKLAPVPAGATAPQLTHEALIRLQPYRDEIATRLNRGEQLAPLVQSIAPRAGLTPGQVALYISALAQTGR